MWGAGLEDSVNTRTFPPNVKQGIFFPVKKWRMIKSLLSRTFFFPAENYFSEFSN